MNYADRRFKQKIPQRAFFATLMSVLLIMALSGCEETVLDPFQNDGRYFTVYGYLDVLETNHEIRVIPVTRQASVITDPSAPNASIDAEVTTTQLSSGNVTRWRHSLERLEDGTYAHIFRASFMVRADDTYRLEVTRSDGIATSAETTIPYISDASLLQLDPIVYSADSIPQTQRVLIPNVASPWNIKAVYLWGGGLINTRVFLPYGRPGRRTEEGSWELTINIEADQEAVRRDIQDDVDLGRLPPGTPVVLSAMGLEIRMLDSNWDPPDGIFDPETLAVPDVLSNVENGYGFFGSIGFYAQEWNACDLSGPLGYLPGDQACITTPDPR